MIDDPQGRFLHIYCDESRQTADRYMVIGGIIAQRENETSFAEAMKLFRQGQNMHAELKWTKVSKMNGAHTRTGAKRAKVTLAEYIAAKAGLLNLQQPTPRSHRHFSIWHFHFRGFLNR